MSGRSRASGLSLAIKRRQNAPIVRSFGESSRRERATLAACTFSNGFDALRNTDIYPLQTRPECIARRRNCNPQIQSRDSIILRGWIRDVEIRALERRIGTKRVKITRAPRGKRSFARANTGPLFIECQREYLRPIFVIERREGSEG